MKQITVRIYTYKTHRRVGGCDAIATPYLCDAVLISSQDNFTYSVKLLSDCAGFSAGDVISVPHEDFDLK